MSNFRLVLCFKHIVVLMLYFFFLMLYWYQNLIVFLLVLYRSHIVAKILCWYCIGVQFWTGIILIVHWCQILLKFCIDIVLMTQKARNKIVLMYWPCKKREVPIPNPYIYIYLSWPFALASINRQNSIYNLSSTPNISLSPSYRTSQSPRSSLTLRLNPCPNSGLRQRQVLVRVQIPVQ